MSDPEPTLTINPNSTWQIGAPQKSTFTTAWSSNKVLITDSINAYPISDTAIFTIQTNSLQSSASIDWFNFNLSFHYSVDSETLTDFGLIEFSPDNGLTWIDLINDPFYSSYLDWTHNENPGESPTLTGLSSGWQEASVNMRQLGLFLSIPPGTQIIWRFSFISDAIQTNRDGLMFDNIYVEITPPIGLSEEALTHSKQLLKVFDLLGRETEKATNTILLYQYSDGSTEKIFINE